MPLQGASPPSEQAGPSPALIEGLQIDYYGTSVTLNQLASISVPEARLLMVQPWDKRSIPAVEKSILKADLGLNPSSDGELIRIPIPALTDERRRDLAKLVNRRVEEGRVSVRTARRESVDQARSLKKAKEISEDEERRATEQLQKLTDSFVKEDHRPRPGQRARAHGKLIPAFIH